MPYSPGYVIAVSSVSGGGKTTLVKKTTDLLKGTALFFDDYASVSKYPPDLQKWLKEGADVNEWQTPQFAQDLAALRSGNSIVSPIDEASILPSEFIVIEEPMGRTRTEIAALIDFVAVIDTPLEIALTRRLLRNLGPIFLDDIDKATKEEMAEDLVQMVTFLKDYLSFGRNLYVSVQDQAKANCDLVLDGSLPVDELARQLVTVVKDKTRTQDT